MKTGHLEEATIRWLMDAAFEATDPNEKARLAATEMRARLVLETFRKRGTNWTMDASTKALIETIGATDYAVMVCADSDGNKVVEATEKKTGERFVVRADDLYMAAIELAQQVGVDLEDG